MRTPFRVSVNSNNSLDVVHLKETDEGILALSFPAAEPVAKRIKIAFEVFGLELQLKHHYIESIIDLYLQENPTDWVCGEYYVEDDDGEEHTSISLFNPYTDVTAWGGNLDGLVESIPELAELVAVPDDLKPMVTRAFCYCIYLHRGVEGTDL